MSKYIRKTFLCINLLDLKLRVTTALYSSSYFKLEMKNKIGSLDKNRREFKCKHCGLVWMNLDEDKCPECKK